jgi:hypothetical protein
MRSANLPYAKNAAKVAVLTTARGWAMPTVERKDKVKRQPDVMQMWRQSGQGMASWLEPPTV